MRRSERRKRREDRCLGKASVFAVGRPYRQTRPLSLYDRPPLLFASMFELERLLRSAEAFVSGQAFWVLQQLSLSFLVRLKLELYL